MVHEAKVTTENYFKLYYGTCKGEFKSRFYNHTKSRRQLKDGSKIYKKLWKIFTYAKRDKCSKLSCDLCLTEKDITGRADQEYLLNMRTEITTKCCHRNKCLIKNVN